MLQTVVFSSRRPCSNMTVGYLGFPLIAPGATVQFHRDAEVPLTGDATDRTPLFDPIVDVLTGVDDVREFALVGREDRHIDVRLRVGQIRVPNNLTGDDLADLIEMAAMLAGLRVRRVDTSNAVLSATRAALAL